MRPTTRFALETHDGPYDQWPLRSRLLVDGEQTSLGLPGYSLLHQFEIKPGFLLVTDYDCPYEETVNFILLSRELRVVSHRSVGTPPFAFVPHASYLLKNIEWLDDWHFVTIPFNEADGRYYFTIREQGIPYLRPRLTMDRVEG